MGLLKSIFGKKTQEIPDGLWLKNYRDCDWIEAFSWNRVNLIQTFEIGTDSCCLINGEYFCVMRISDSSQETFGYTAICIPRKRNDAFSVIVDRVEYSTGETLKKDDWSKGRVMKESYINGISNTINLVESYASFNNYSTTPPYMLFIKLAQKYI